MRIAIVCQDNFHEGARRVLCEFETDEMAAMAGVHDWVEVPIRRRRGTWLGPAGGRSLTNLGADDQPVPLEAFVSAEEDARSPERWPDPVQRRVYEFRCKGCGAQQQVRHENMRAVLDLLSGAGVAEISLSALPDAIHRIRHGRRRHR